MAETWEISNALAEKTRFKAFNKKHPREYAACFSNLGHIVDLLNRYGSVGAFQVAFFRSEGENVYRIGQTGVPHAVETRLYIYICVNGHTIYVLTIGDKSQQADGIRRCRKTVKEFEKGRAHEHSRNDHSQTGG